MYIGFTKKARRQLISLTGQNLSMMTKIATTCIGSLFGWCDRELLQLKIHMTVCVSCVVYVSLFVVVVSFS